MKIKVYLMIALVFLLGMLSGGLILMQCVQSRLENITTSSTTDVHERIFKLLDKKLNLSDPQQAKISEILKEAANEIQPLRTEMRTKFLAFLRENSSKIEGELDAEQQQEFEEIVSGLIESLNLNEDLK